MSARAALRVVDTGKLPPYPIERSIRLDSHSFVKWYHNRWLNSRLHLTASYEVQGMARALFDIAQNQSPVGTLPDEDIQLARLLRLDLSVWQEVRARAISPLHNWVKCIADGEIRLMHPVVLEVVRDALERREQHGLSKEAKAEAMRFKRLREGLVAMGVAKAVLDDEVLIARLDEWLTAHCKGNRTRIVLQRSLEHAGKQGWLNAPA